MFGYLDVVKYAVSRGVDTLEIDDYRHLYHHPDIVKYLLSLNYHMIDEDAALGWSSLYGTIDVIKHILSREVDVDKWNMFLVEKVNSEKSIFDKYLISDDYVASAIEGKNLDVLQFFNSKGKKFNIDHLRGALRDARNERNLIQRLKLFEIIKYIINVMINSPDLQEDEFISLLIEMQKMCFYKKYDDDDVICHFINYILQPTIYTIQDHLKKYESDVLTPIPMFVKKSKNVNLFEPNIIQEISKYRSPYKNRSPP